MFAGHADSAAHSSNHCPGRSVRPLCTGVCAPISSGDHVKQTLEKFRKMTSSIKHIAKFQAYKTNGVVKRTKL